MSNMLTDHEQENKHDDFSKQLRLLPVVLLGLLLNAYLLLLMWHWFIAPLGVRDLSFWQSAGLSAVFSYLRGNPYQNKEKRDYQEMNFVKLPSFL